jgi:hypothetical protein|tara:strand:- start:665 stop:2449 length:1785 start_codon:yes stop_codon:yes gene_type:complete
MATDSKKKVKVAVVGAGIAGLTTALRLSERGYAVTLYEEKEILGGNLSSRKVGDLAYDVYPHMFCDWYKNFWHIFECDLEKKREDDFEKRLTVKFLRKGEKEYIELKGQPNLQNTCHNLFSGLRPPADMFLYGYSMIDLASQRFDPGELLSRHSVNGFLHSRGYASDRSAELYELITLDIWSVHSYQTSASAYKDFLEHSFGTPGQVMPFAWALKGTLDDKLIQPLHDKLKKLKCNVQMGCRVDKVILEDGKITLEITSTGETAKKQTEEQTKEQAETKTKKQIEDKPDYLVFAVPPQALANLVESADKGSRIVDRVPDLSKVRRLESEPIPVAYFYFNKKLSNIPKQHVALRPSNYELTFLDLSQLYENDPNMTGNTVLVVAASNYYALPSDNCKESGYLMLKGLHDYLQGFDPGSSWGVSPDVDWSKSTIQMNTDHKLFINEVGSPAWSPQASYCELPNVFFAGDFCRNDVSMATIEGAVLSGLEAAQAVWCQKRLGPPIDIAELDKPCESTLLAWKLALAPTAYWAKWYSLASDVVCPPREGVCSGLPKAAAGMLRLPFDYAGDCIETAFALGSSLLGRRRGALNRSQSSQ